MYSLMSFKVELVSSSLSGWICIKRITFQVLLTFISTKKKPESRNLLASHWVTVSYQPSVTPKLDQKLYQVRNQCKVRYLEDYFWIVHHLHKGYNTKVLVKLAVKSMQPSLLSSDLVCVWFFDRLGLRLFLLGLLIFRRFLWLRVDTSRTFSL